jgi:hypothetical protein
VTWAWEYEPDEPHVVGEADPGFIAQVEKKADELVRAASALYLDGTSYQGIGPGVATAYVPGGMFEYLTAVRQERLYVLQVTQY